MKKPKRENEKKLEASKYEFHSKNHKTINADTTNKYYH